MDILLAIDIMDGFVVQGQSGNRSGYRPLDWGLVPDAEPAAYTAAMKPVYGYVADLDGVEGTGTDNEASVRACCHLLKKSYVNRGRRAYTVSEEDRNAGIFPVISTETGGKNLPKYHGGALTVDLKCDRVYPTGELPAAFLKTASDWDYDVCIVINLGSVGTESGLPTYLSEMRSAYEGTLFYGGGLASEEDLGRVAEAGYNGALVATAVHRHAIPLDAVQRGYYP
ncbi:HisA/HisF-related TIM barrel protein [Methanogenium organophilum]|uniref:HisA/HisF-related TIM barrel protein n=1 Tax=Methanogenium organophilum TaxID=2199 RepID=A0A9X9S646_METOG|nr:HisA/HisF-related TIM barrel protein [Methanogenium organophilum]WAI02448.1 HisA/HisF-related TIM barrel protein [Methanogenium organophilum]